MKKILWDKLNKRECIRQYFFDQYGDCYINGNPFGANMNGKIEISLVPDDHPQYEIKEIKE